ncbi:MAG: hypothetical protein M0R77_18860 [Gammaproteobacteria bacterium]|nr:hypothetical protein [Gammaproteobacteria bacterium]
MFYVKKYDENGDKLGKIRHDDILDAFMNMGQHYRNSDVETAKMVGTDGKVYSVYIKFD